MLLHALGTYVGPDRVDAFIGYCADEYIMRRRREAFETYVTDAFWLNGRGMAHGERFIDLIRPKPEIDVEAVIGEIAEGAGLEIV